VFKVLGYEEGRRNISLLRIKEGYPVKGMRTFIRDGESPVNVLVDTPE